jgi:uncharacterized membrane protein YvbJ
MGKAKCVHCGKEVFEWAPECPYCKKPIANPHAPTNVAPAPRTWKEVSYKKKSRTVIIAAGIVLVIIAAIVLYIIKFKIF